MPTFNLTTASFERTFRKSFLNSDFVRSVCPRNVRDTFVTAESTLPTLHRCHSWNLDRLHILIKELVAPAQYRQRETPDIDHLVRQIDDFGDGSFYSRRQAAQALRTLYEKGHTQGDVDSSVQTTLMNALRFYGELPSMPDGRQSGRIDRFTPYRIPEEKGVWQIQEVKIGPNGTLAVPHDLLNRLRRGSIQEVRIRAGAYANPRGIRDYDHIASIGFDDQTDCFYVKNTSARVAMSIHRDSPDDPTPIIATVFPDHCQQEPHFLSVGIINFAYGDSDSESSISFSVDVSPDPFYVLSHLVGNQSTESTCDRVKEILFEAIKDALRKGKNLVDFITQFFALPAEFFEDTEASFVLAKVITPLLSFLEPEEQERIIKQAENNFLRALKEDRLAIGMGKYHEMVFNDNFLVKGIPYLNRHLKASVLATLARGLIYDNFSEVIREDLLVLIHGCSSSFEAAFSAEQFNRAEEELVAFGIRIPDAKKEDKEDEDKVDEHEDDQEQAGVVIVPQEFFEDRFIPERNLAKGADRRPLFAVFREVITRNNNDNKYGRNVAIELGLQLLPFLPQSERIKELRFLAQFIFDLDQDARNLVKEHLQKDLTLIPLSDQIQILQDLARRDISTIHAAPIDLGKYVVPPVVPPPTIREAKIFIEELLVGIS